MTIHYGRRWRAVATAAAMTVAAALAGCPADTPAGDPSARSASGPSAPPTGEPGPTTQPAAVLVPPTYALPTFPLAARDVPDGLGRPRVGLIQGTPVLNFPFGGGEVSVRITRSRPDDDPRTSGMRRLKAKIGSADAVMLDGDYRDALDVTKLVVLTWRLSDGRWARVIGMDALTRDDVLRLARGLRPGTTPAGRPPVTLALAPAGYDLVHLDVRSLCLAPRGAVDEISTSVCVGWAPYELRGAESLRVRGQEADLLAYENVIELRVKVRPGVTLQVSAHDLTREDVIRIAEGATVNG